MHDIRPFIPELFTQSGTLLYIGARADAHSWLDELYEAGNIITVLEVWPDNVTGLIGYPAIHDLVQGSVKEVDTIFIGSFDYIFYWHGPEHLTESEIAPTLAKLEVKCNRLIALACPYGVYPQGSHKGNPYEEHKTTLYSDFFIRLGYEVRTDGEPDMVGSEIVAWKVMG
jgi:hypothetical protein